MSASVIRAGRGLLAAGFVLAAAGCTLPRSGPSSSAFARADQAAAIVLTDATPAAAAASRAPDQAHFPQAWREAAPADIDRIGAGDVLRITIFERDGLGLFAGDQTGAATIDPVTVDADGDIQLPYVGRVPVGGQSLGAAHALLLRRINRLALSSDVQLGFVERHSQIVSVQGDVLKSGAVPLSRETSRLTSLLSLATPTPGDIEQAVVTVRRGDVAASVRLSDILDRSAENIALQPADIVIVRNRAETVNLLGAAGVQGRLRLVKRNYTVLDAVSDARGLDGDAANPAAVYLMQLADAAHAPAGGPRVYRFDFRNPAHLALAAAFSVHDGDAIFIASASFTQTQKILSAFSGVLNTARSASVVAP